jgi:hypothetical protein
MLDGDPSHGRHVGADVPDLVAGKPPGLGDVSVASGLPDGSDNGCKRRERGSELPLLLGKSL